MGKLTDSIAAANFGHVWRCCGQLTGGSNKNWGIDSSARLVRRLSPAAARVNSPKFSHRRGPFSVPGGVSSRGKNSVRWFAGKHGVLFLCDVSVAFVSCCRWVYELFMFALCACCLYFVVLSPLVTGFRVSLGNLTVDFDWSGDFIAVFGALLVPFLCVSECSAPSQTSPHAIFY